jgi:HTH-type transcriptional regulator, global nitrogen regulator NrpRI
MGCKRQTVAEGCVVSFDRRDVDRKILSILKVLQKHREPIGGRLIAQKLRDHGVVLGERAVRYHLKLMDERGLTLLRGNQDGRVITEKGLAEVKNALVKDKVGFAISKIESLAFRTTFDFRNRTGNVPLNVSFFARSDFGKALLAMKPAFDSGFCVSQLVVVGEAGQVIGDLVVPEDQVGIGTVCSIVINGALLKAGVPMDSRFSGTLQMNDGKPMRFTEIINYSGCSLDPSEIFIKARMTSVTETIATGGGEILANFRETPAVCLPLVEEVTAGLGVAGIGGVIARGGPSESVCEVSVEPNRVGIVLIGGLNPVAAAQEVGIEAENHSMSTVVDYGQLNRFSEVLAAYKD